MARAPKTPAIMLQGTGSSVGKSLLVAGLCRYFARRGLKVRPFKPQNMSNNAAVTPDGGEIGRAQALQARAAGIAPSVYMNPVLLKPESETGSQIIVQGRRWDTLKAREYWTCKRDLMRAVLGSFEEVASGADLVIVEGAGSPAEINLRSGDIANMGFAEAASVPVILVGDVERGGVIASLVGCKAVLSPEDASRIEGYIVNKFRGDVSLFEDALGAISERTGWPSLGVVPFFPRAMDLPAEDGADLDGKVAVRTSDRRPIRIIVPVLPRIANFDDLDPLRLEPDVEVEMIRPGRPLPLDCDLIILPGSKSTISDLEALRSEGWDIDIRAHVRRGGVVLGLCGGFQMLGKQITDPDGIEGPASSASGLGLLAVETVLSRNKTVQPVSGLDSLTGLPVSGYEIHLGVTSGPDTERPFVVIDGKADGARSADGRVLGTYVHGLFASDVFRAHFLSSFRSGEIHLLAYEARIDATLDAFADHVARHIDCDRLMAIAQSRIHRS